MSEDETNRFCSLQCFGEESKMEGERGRDDIREKCREGGRGRLGERGMRREKKGGSESLSERDRRRGRKRKEEKEKKREKMEGSDRR